MSNLILHLEKSPLTYRGSLSSNQKKNPSELQTLSLSLRRTYILISRLSKFNADTLNILAWYLLKWIHVGTLSKAVAQRKSNMNTFKCEATESAHSAVCTIQESQTQLSGVEEVNICMKLLNQLVRVWLNNCNTTGVISGPKSFLGSLSVAPTGILKGGPTLKKGASGRERVRRVTGAGTSGPVC